MSDYPYAERFEVNRRLPEHGRPRAEILEELRTIAHEEDAFWETGKCSGTMYCGDHEHYAFLNEAFGLFAHVNALQRDMCPSQTRFEGEIIAMALDLMHAEAVEDGEPAGLVTSGGTSSIAHAVLAYRDHARASRDLPRPNFVKPETAHPAFDKACHLFGVELRGAGRPRDDAGRRRRRRGGHRRADARDRRLGLQLRVRHHRPDRGAGGWRSSGASASTSTAASAASSSRSARSSATTSPVFDFRVPGVTSISADTHKYGYALKGTSSVIFRDKALRNAQYFFLTDWSGGKYCSPGIDGSRSRGLLAATWAAMVSLGREGYLRYAREIFATSAAMQDAVRSHPELRLLGQPTFLFSFTSDAFDVYHVNDFMRPRGWRFNGQQYPNALHMAVTRPQTQPGVVEAFAADLADAVASANERHATGEQPASGAVYGGFPGGPSTEADELIRAVMADLLDRMQALPG